MRPFSPNMIGLYRFLWVWLTLLLALWFGWHLLAQFDFLYPVWHDYAGISQNIDKYAPLNHYRHDFELTDRETRFALFHGIVEAIHNHGQGLKELVYQTRNGTVSLLRHSEIVHLQDVANLIDFVNHLALVLGTVWLVITLLIWSKLSAMKREKWIKQSFTRRKDSLLNLTIGLALSIGGILLIGAEKVFYQLHIWVFPANHQWFFYYEHSLMSTMMKAPDLFAMIAITLLILGLAFFVIIQLAINALLSTR
ncbi:DUF1461 domain-containing protein [Thiomicrorhabdus sp.]|uniref:lipoprotein intramolecular transacylase Lit n=1 Tax=Thiomicrorhabdus sp. TaxID=2039724 RepID=UPI0029C641E6|nr:DUF1461 domain-containing protein [Thiomicrorhabdus sp.]